MRGDLRPDFKRVAMTDFSPRLVTDNGFYVTIEIFRDTDYYRDFTQKVVASQVHREFNPGFYDGFGERIFDKWNKDADKSVFMPRTNYLRECEFTRFFAIEGAPPPENIRQAFAETRFNHSQESIDRGVRIMEHFIAKYARD